MKTTNHKSTYGCLMLAFVCIVVVTSCQREIDFDYPNRPTEFIDLESGKRIKLMPSEVSEKYREEMVRQTADIKQHAIRYRIDYQPIDTQQGFDQVLLPFLLKRNRHV